MNLDFAFLCDHAEAGDKLHALGIGFDTIFAREAPATHPHFCVVAQLRCSAAEAGDKMTDVRLIDADGKDVINPIRAMLRVPPPPQGHTESVTRMVIAMKNVRFERYGSYAIHMVVQGRELASIPLKIAPAPAPPAR